ncbi:cytochrome c oxidase assembly protein [Halobacillus sp. A5]|uniref:cytochrome c oxidase assembly protein n=1 Tax=Halobacillus sp. A5 TaxID=2880263 RepID=UPI0020A63C39|nr:cytochrome c oxidase assembly protein [Halobacillus sp. A5]MCP3028331.1 cytochrome c oxidase assembly protein [Halobacillus sp. A5]
MSHHSDHMLSDGAVLWSQVILSLPFILAALGYAAALYRSKRKNKKWSFYRTLLWFTGVLCAVISVAGPLAQWAHTNFTAHMAGHLLLGMLAPLLMVFAAPLTLLFRALPINYAKKVTKLLRSRFVNVLMDPFTASMLNVGGLWVLYSTSLYALMHEYLVLHIFVHVHVFLAGYLFTASMIYVDPVSHRRRYTYRAVILTAALAFHGILSKYIYSHPPAGVPSRQAEAGGKLMYYGGDAVDLVLIFFLCMHWYHAARPRSVERGRETCQTV